MLGQWDLITLMITLWAKPVECNKSISEWKAIDHYGGNDGVLSSGVGDSGSDLD